MDSIRDISKEKDIIRIIGRMPDTVLDKDPGDDSVDILDRVYEVRIESQDRLYSMLQKAGYQVTKSNIYTAVIIGDRVSEESLKSLPEGCKKIDVYSLASWLVDNNIAVKEYHLRQKPSYSEEVETIETPEKKNIWLSIFVGIVAVAGVLCFLPIFVVIILFVPGALNKFAHSLIR